MLKIAQISDLHFSQFTMDWKQFFSKRWIGNFNLLFSRKNAFLSDRPYTLIDLFHQLKVDLVVIAGDVSSTSLEKEFEMGKAFVDTLSQSGIPSIVIPGNHDSYTASAHKRRLFYRYFPNEPLKQERVSLHSLAPHLWLVALDTTLATPFFKSTGLFTPVLASKLRATLDEIPSSDKIILVNHFPFFRNDLPLRSLEGADQLRALLKDYPNCQLYLHGHTHRHVMCDLRPSHLPIVLDSGCLSYSSGGTWNLIELSQNECQVKAYEWKNGWEIFRRGTFPW